MGYGLMMRSYRVDWHDNGNAETGIYEIIEETHEYVVFAFKDFILAGDGWSTTWHNEGSIVTEKFLKKDNQLIMALDNGRLGDGFTFNRVETYFPFALLH